MSYRKSLCKRDLMEKERARQITEKSCQNMGGMTKRGMIESCEAALVKVLNDIHLNTDSGRISVLVLLDLSAAFDTVDHNILPD